MLGRGRSGEMKQGRRITLKGRQETIIGREQAERNYLLGQPVYMGFIIVLARW